jgi:flavorubredoxin
MHISDSVFYIGVNDHKIDLFESQFPVPNGMSYNSYAIIDEKIAIMDSVDINFTDEWLNNIENLLCGRRPDYLIVHHMEPDHSANIDNFMQKYPDAKIVASKKAFDMITNFFGVDYQDRKIIVGDGDTLSLGKHVLSFITMPMVHWPEVIASYDSYDKLLFSANAFGKFGALDVEDDWVTEARRYYFGIVAKYGAQVQAVLKKLKEFNIQKICPLHGPVLSENINRYIDLYNTWSSYNPEQEGIVIAYTSIYGNTKRAAMLLKEQLELGGCKNIVVYDLARSDISAAVADAFRYDKTVFVTTTYNNGLFPFMRIFLNFLVDRNFQNRKVAFIENGSWAPSAAQRMKEKLSACKNITYLDTKVTIVSATNEQSIEQIKLLAEELCR